MNLFELNESHELQIQPEAYALRPFRILWDRDDSPDKSVAQGELAFVYFMADYKSMFNVETDLLQRAKDVREGIFTLPKDWKPDEYVYAAVEFYKSHQSTISMLLLDDIYQAINNLRKFYREVDLTEKDDKGKPVHDVSKLTRSIEATGKIMESLAIIEDKVKREIETTGKKAGRQKGFFEDAPKTK